MNRTRSRVIETRSGRYRVAWIPIARSPLPGFSACAVQAVPMVLHPRNAIRLVLYERITPTVDDEQHAA